MGTIVRWIGINTDLDDQITTETLDVQLRRCCEALIVLRASFARIWTYNSSQEVLDLRASAGLYTHLDGAHAHVPLGAFKFGRLAQRRLPPLTNAVAGDPEISDHAWATREGMVAFAGYPLVVGDRRRIDGCEGHGDVDHAAAYVSA